MPDPTSVFQSPQSSPAQAVPPEQPHGQPQSQTPQFSAQPSVAESPSFSQAGATVAMADPSHIQKSPFRFLPFILGGLVVFGIIFFIVSRVIGGLKQNGPSLSTTPPAGSDTQTGGGVARPGGSQKTIPYGGLWEPSAAMTDVLSEYQKQNNVVVQYQQQSPKDYRERLQDALKKGQGPDVFRFHATWTPMLRTSLAVLPSSLMSRQDFEKTFYPVAAKDLETPDGVVGIPLMYDGLGLYYNKTLFQTAGKTPPTTWADLETIAKDLTVRNTTTKKIDRAGIALGTTTNVDNFSDILALLLFQNNADPANPSTQLASDAIKYYTNFYRALKVWDETLPNSTYAFATEKSAMMFAPSWRAFEVKAINPNLDFGIAPVPQLPGTNVAFASYWAEGVSKTSKNTDLAWKLLVYMSSKDVMQKLHNASAQNTPRLFGEIYSRVDMKDLIASDPYMGAYIQDAPKAQSWYLSSRTFDNGIDDQTIKYYENVINSVNSGDKTLQEALVTADKGVKQVLQLFGVLVSPAGGATSTTP